MKEIRAILAALAAPENAGRRAALAMVARVEGSSYRRTGARMLVFEDGTYLGGISGGCLEGDALRRAQKALVSNRPSVVTYDTTRDDHHQIGVGLGCNGVIDVLFVPCTPGDAVPLLRERADTRQPRLLATITETPDPAWLGKTLPMDAKETWLDAFPWPEAEAVWADAETCLVQQRSQTFQYGETWRICIEVLMPALRLVLFGSNNDLRPMTRIARELGWEVAIVANPLKLDRGIFQLANQVLDPHGTQQPTFDAFTAVVLMAHDYKTDLRHLESLLPIADVAYIGLLGPRKRAEKMFQALADAGKMLLPDDQARIFAPAGLDIGAATPEEIALSIAAEIRAHFSGRNGGFLRLRAQPIYGW